MFTWSFLNLQSIVCVHVNTALTIAKPDLLNPSLYNPRLFLNFWQHRDTKFAIARVHSLAARPHRLPRPSVRSLRCCAANTPTDKQPNRSGWVPCLAEFVCPADKQGVPGLPLWPWCRLKGNKLSCSLCEACLLALVTKQPHCRSPRRNEWRSGGGCNGNIRGLAL